MKALLVTDKNRPAIALWLCSTGQKHPHPKVGEYVCVRPHDRPLPTQHSTGGTFLPTEYVEVPACVPIELLGVVSHHIMVGKDIARVEDSTFAQFRVEEAMIPDDFDPSDPEVFHKLKFRVLRTSRSALRPDPREGETEVLDAAEVAEARHLHLFIVDDRAHVRAQGAARHAPLPQAAPVVAQSPIVISTETCSLMPVGGQRRSLASPGCTRASLASLTMVPCAISSTWRSGRD